MISLPVLDANDSILEVDLEGDTYFLRMSWNSEGEFWVMSLEDYANNTLLAGVRVVPDVALLQMFHHLPVPPGEFWAVLMDDTRQDFLRTDFADGTAALIYVEAGEDVTV
jgi:hypothetical protein